MDRTLPLISHFWRGACCIGAIASSESTAAGARRTKAQKWAFELGIAGLVLVVGPTIGAVGIGAVAVRDRELPLVTLQAAPVAAAPSASTGRWTEGTIEVTITARAVGMTTKNDLLVQVIGLYSDPGPSVPSRHSPGPLHPRQSLHSQFLPRMSGSVSRIMSEATKPSK
jgi:hypothetical protein